MEGLKCWEAGSGGGREDAVLSRGVCGTIRIKSIHMARLAVESGHSCGI